MNNTEASIKRDIERVKQITIVPTLLDVICQTTGMGFAAIARVTESRWITCSVLDHIQFGLVPGSELKLETTICNEIRDSRQPVVIDHVQSSKIFANHHTPLMYGFQSYISYPIILKSGEFFGTLCAIDPNPAQLENSKIIGMFSAFSDLISFHLQQIELLEQSDLTLKSISRKLDYTLDENRQYRHISHHSLQEPLRKLRMFSGMLIDALKGKDTGKAEVLANRIQAGATRFSGMIKDLAEFSTLEEDQPQVKINDLNKILADVCVELQAFAASKGASIQVDKLPSINASPQQIRQLFYQLLHNAIKFSRKGVSPLITVSGRTVELPESYDQLNEAKKLVEITITDNGQGIAPGQLENIFDMFSKLPSENSMTEGEGFGLTFCRKIIRNHSGEIKMESEVDKGTTVLVVLPL